MSTQRLREELARIAETAPVADVPIDTWARAQRFRARQRALAVAVAAACVALLAAVVVWLPERLDPPVADTDGLGVPDRLWAVPDRMSARDGGDTWSRDEVTSELAVGRGAAAWVTDQGLPVVVDAEDGTYHLLDLPGFTGNSSFLAGGAATATPVALSPDGRWLAYAWATIGPDAATQPIPSGVRVLDLGSGDLREIPLPGEEGTLVTSIAWSADSRWLAWAGSRMGSWTAHSLGAQTTVAGRIPPGSTTSEAVTYRALDPAPVLAIDEAGVVTLASSGLVRWDRRVVARAEPADYLAPTTAASLRDGRVASGSHDDLTLRLVDASGEVVVVDVSGPRPFSAGGSTYALGSVGDRVLVRTTTLDSSDGTLLLVDPARGSTQPVGTTDARVPATLSIATALMTADRPTVPRPEPDWPWSEERWAVTIGLGVGVALTAALGVRALLRRASRHIGAPRSAR